MFEVGLLNHPCLLASFPFFIPQQLYQLLVPLLLQILGLSLPGSVLLVFLDYQHLVI